MTDLAELITTESTPEMRKLAREVATAMFSKRQVERHLGRTKLEALLLATLWKWEKRRTGDHE